MRQSELDELQFFKCHERRLSNENYKKIAATMKQNAIDESFETESSESEGGRKYNHVKFSSHVDGIEPLETDTDTVMSERVDMTAFNDFSKTSTPHVKINFSKFRAKLINGEVDTNLSLNESQLLQEEIVPESTCDDDKSAFDETLTQQKSALVKRNERVRMEVYFHDERMKIKEKQEQLEHRMKKAQKPTRKDRDEVIKLNEKISHLEAELKAKEVKHGSAQARLRAQVRTLEKQLREQKLEYDVMKREPLNVKKLID